MSETRNEAHPDLRPIPRYPSRSAINAAWDRLAGRCEEEPLHYSNDLLLIANGIANLRERNAAYRTELERIAACEPAHRERVLRVLAGGEVGE